ncbi:hypothetical protein R6Q59_006389 [Mikania micrantha]
MKIFSWVHRQFQHKDSKNTDNENVALLENEDFAWREGILAIGTLGIDLFQDFTEKDETFMSKQVLFFDDSDDHDKEMECPLLLNACMNDVEKLDLSPCDDVPKPDNHQEDHVKDLTKIKKSGERTTLADLLRADSEISLFKNFNELSDDHMIKVPYDDYDNSGTVSIKSFLISKTKKKLRNETSAQLIKKTKQLMRKMLKKKIHPDIGFQKETALFVSQEMDVHES